MKVQNKVILVTGAGSGIGRELALCLLARGARVAGVDIAPESLAETARLAAAHQQEFEGFTASVADRLAVEALPEQIIARFGAIDGIINNAGIIQPFSRLNDLDYSTIERVLNVNLFGTLFVTKTFLPHLLERPDAHIVNISSMGGFAPVPGQTIYCAAKAAVKMMTEGLASELLHTNVRVTVVFPGAVATNIRSNSGLGSPGSAATSGARMALPASQAARIIVDGMERDAPRVFVGKDSALMDKLYRLNPTFAARAIAKKMRALLPE
ncbi:MAG TPA: SDR family oxidoreductase [Paludibaculum sp.]|jgi:NAD(P)-dependent dehydrogenase (short-subunit alcohol dehydrogenase family)